MKLKGRVRRDKKRVVSDLVPGSSVTRGAGGKRKKGAANPLYPSNKEIQRRAIQLEMAQRQVEDYDAEEGNEQDDRAETSMTPFTEAQPSADRESGGSTRKHLRHKVLVFASRGSTARERFLLKDLLNILPHHKKEAKLEKKDRLSVINEVCELLGCHSTLFIESRKRMDTYLWAAFPPHGPTVKFLVQNIHTMGELKMTGNCLKGSRPIIVFDSAFDASPLTRLFKTMLSQSFNTPNRHYKSKPFFDHLFNFSLLDGRIWFRHFQVVWPGKHSDGDVELAEIGPRFALLPICAFAGSFRGEKIFNNKEYISPNEIRAQLSDDKGKGYVRRVLQKKKTKKRKAEAVVPPTELDRVFHGGDDMDVDELVSE